MGTTYEAAPSVLSSARLQPSVTAYNRRYIQQQLSVSSATSDPSTSDPLLAERVVYTRPPTTSGVVGRRRAAPQPSSAPLQPSLASPRAVPAAVAPSSSASKVGATWGRSTLPSAPPPRRVPQRPASAIAAPRPPWSPPCERPGSHSASAEHSSRLYASPTRPASASAASWGFSSVYGSSPARARLSVHAAQREAMIRLSGPSACVRATSAPRRRSCSPGPHRRPASRPGSAHYPSHSSPTRARSRAAPGSSKSERQGGGAPEEEGLPRSSIFDEIEAATTRADLLRDVEPLLPWQSEAQGELLQLHSAHCQLLLSAATRMFMISPSSQQTSWNRAYSSTMSQISTTEFLPQRLLFPWEARARVRLVALAAEYSEGLLEDAWRMHAAAKREVHLAGEEGEAQGVAAVQRSAALEAESRRAAAEEVAQGAQAAVGEEEARHKRLLEDFGERGRQLEAEAALRTRHLDTARQEAARGLALAQEASRAYEAQAGEEARRAEAQWQQEESARRRDTAAADQERHRMAAELAASKQQEQRAMLDRMRTAAVQEQNRKTVENAERKRRAAEEEVARILHEDNAIAEERRRMDGRAVSRAEEEEGEARRLAALVEQHQDALQKRIAEDEARTKLQDEAKQKRLQVWEEKKSLMEEAAQRASDKRRQQLDERQKKKAAAQPKEPLDDSEMPNRVRLKDKPNSRASILQVVNAKKMAMNLVGEMKKSKEEQEELARLNNEIEDESRAAEAIALAERKRLEDEEAQRRRDGDAQADEQRAALVAAQAADRAALEAECALARERRGKEREEDAMRLAEMEAAAQARRTAHAEQEQARCTEDEEEKARMAAEAEANIRQVEAAAIEAEQMRLEDLADSMRMLAEAQPEADAKRGAAREAERARAAAEAEAHAGTLQRQTAQAAAHLEAVLGEIQRFGAEVEERRRVMGEEGPALLAEGERRLTAALARKADAQQALQQATREAGEAKSADTDASEQLRVKRAAVEDARRTQEQVERDAKDRRDQQWLYQVDRVQEMVRRVKVKRRKPMGIDKTTKGSIQFRGR